MTAALLPARIGRRVRGESGSRIPEWGAPASTAAALSFEVAAGTKAGAGGSVAAGTKAGAGGSAQRGGSYVCRFRLQQVQKQAPVAARSGAGRTSAASGCSRYKSRRRWQRAAGRVVRLPLPVAAGTKAGAGGSAHAGSGKIVHTLEEWRAYAATTGQDAIFAPRSLQKAKY